MRPLIYTCFLGLLSASCVGKAAPAPDAVESKPAVSRKPVFIAAPAGDAVAVVEQALKAAGDDQQVVVYVGAEWCEPCTRFHEAVVHGELDKQLAGVQFVEFDSDRDRDRLLVAGYGGKLIPRFVRPGKNGRATGRRIEGGVKGQAAVEHIMTRLLGLLDPH